MQLRNGLVKRFQALYYEKFGEEISFEAAQIQLQQLVDLLRVTSPNKENKKNA